MSLATSGMPRLMQIAADAVREHGGDWPSVSRAIAEALKDLPDVEREALDAEIATNDGLLSSDVDKLGR